MVSGRIDWSKRTDYIRERHQVEPSWATEAVNDPDHLWRQPDPASTSGHSIRVIGYSHSAEAIMTVILVDPAADPTNRPDGDWWGANAWRSNKTDQRDYLEALS